MDISYRLSAKPVDAVLVIKRVFVYFNNWLE